MILLPVVLMLAASIVDLTGQKTTAWGRVIAFLGTPLVALLITTVFAMVALGYMQKFSRDAVNGMVGQSFGSVAGIILIVAAGGGFKQTLVDSGIGDVSVFGNAQSAMRIWLDPEKMGLMGITIKDVENAIEAQNAQRSAGRVGTAPTVSEQQLYYTITTPGQLLTAEEFADIIVKADGPDKLVRMKDIATTVIGKRSYEFRVDINGTQGVNVGVYLQTGANAMAAAETVKARIVELAAQFPENKIDYIISDDSSSFVGASLNEVYHTLFEAGILVLLVVFVFLQNWRATLIPMLAVPVSLIGTMAGLWLFGFSLNTLTRFA